MELGIGLAHSLASMSFLIPHLGIGIRYWIGSCMSIKIVLFNMDTLELELGIGFAHSVAGVLVFIPHLRIGIGH